MQNWTLEVRSKVGYRLNSIDCDFGSAYRFWFLFIPHFCIKLEDKCLDDKNVCIVNVPVAMLSKILSKC